MALSNGKFYYLPVFLQSPVLYGTQIGARFIELTGLLRSMTEWSLIDNGQPMIRAFITSPPDRVPSVLSFKKIPISSHAKKAAPIFRPSSLGLVIMFASNKKLRGIKSEHSQPPPKKKPTWV